MKGSFFLGEHTFAVREMNLPPLGDYDVLIQNMACGVCGTDVHIAHGEGGSADVMPPVVIGHEYSGIVTGVGKKVTVVETGDHVAVDPNIYCGKCLPCRMGKKQNCENLFALGVNLNGGFAEYSVAPEAQCIRVGKDIDFDAAAMAEPLACAIHGIDRAGILPGHTVAVVGGGTIGLLMVQLAKLSGASSVVLSEPIEMRRKVGLDVGADYAMDPLSGDAADLFQKLTGRRGADVVIECVGKPAAVTQSIQLADSGASVLLFSVPAGDATIPLPLFDVYKKELKITGSFINPDTQQRAVNMLNSNRLHIRELITHTYGLAGVKDAIDMQMTDRSIKVVVHPQE